MKRIACLLLVLVALFAPLANAADETKAVRAWCERGKDLLNFVLSVNEDIAEANGEGDSRFSLRESLSNIANEYKERYKEEGRAYARELGDTLVERIRQDEKIASTITTVHVFCWAVTVYLTLVTIFIVFAIRRINRDNARLLALLEKRGEEK